MGREASCGLVSVSSNGRRPWYSRVLCCRGGWAGKAGIRGGGVLAWLLFVLCCAFDGSGYAEIAAPEVSLQWMDVVEEVQYSSDGARIVALDASGALSMWNADLSAQVLPLTLTKKRIYRFALAPDASQIALARTDGAVEIWTLDGAAVLESLHLLDAEDRVDALSWSQDSARLAVVSAGKLSAWNVAQDSAAYGTQLFAIEDDTVSFISAAWSTADSRLAVGLSQMDIWLYEYNAGAVNAVQRVQVLTHGVEQAPQFLGWSPDATQLFSFRGGDDVMCVWNVAPDSATYGACVQQMNARAFNAAAWSPDGKRLATAVRKLSAPTSVAALWDMDPASANYGAEVECLTPPAFSHIYSVAWSPDGRKLVSAGYGIRVWDVDAASSTYTQQLNVEGTQIAYAGLSLAWSPDGKQLAAGTVSGKVELWTAPLQGQAPVVLAGHEGMVQSVSWSPDSKRLATTGTDAKIIVWDVDLTSEGYATALFQLSDGREWVDASAWSPDGKLLATGAGRYNEDWESDLVYGLEVCDVRVTLWDMDVQSDSYGEARYYLDGHTGRIRTLAWSPDGQRLAIGSAAREMHWDCYVYSGETILWGFTASPEEEWQSLLTLGFPTASLAFSPDGQALACGAMIGCMSDETEALTIRNADPKSLQFGETIVVFEDATSTVGSMAWSANGRFLATAFVPDGSEDTLPAVNIWNTQLAPTVSTQLATSLSDLYFQKYGTDPHANALSWSPDGQYLATVSPNSSVNIWAVTPSHSSDFDGAPDNTISLSELLRFIQLYNSGGYHCAAKEEASEDGYTPGTDAICNCNRHTGDYALPAWEITLTELLRVIQFFNTNGYHTCADAHSDEGFCPGAANTD